MEKSNFLTSTHGIFIFNISLLTLIITAININKLLSARVDMARHFVKDGGNDRIEMPIYGSSGKLINILKYIN